jgi:hypothetical protein
MMSSFFACKVDKKNLTVASESWERAANSTLTIFENKTDFASEWELEGKSWHVNKN